MKLPLCCLVAAAVWLVSAGALRPRLAQGGPIRLSSKEDMILRDKYRRETMLEQREVEYHKQLRKDQEKLAANLRRPRGAYRDTPTNPDDYDAIVALYHSTNGPQWANNTGWLKGDPCSSPYWFGIYCINGRVLQINLPYNDLSGPLPSTLSRASALQVVRLYDNLITGEFPLGLFTLQSLQILDVSTNQITGGLPSVIDMANLTQLTLFDNQMKGVFTKVIRAPNLQILEVSSNSFSDNLPEGLSQSTGLTDLVVSRNSFTGSLPASYGKLGKLQKLWIFYNNFDRPTIPDSYQQLVNLVEVQADGLSGPLPQWIGSSWRKIQYLILINGWLSGSYPVSLCDCKDMVSLRLFNNSLKGEIPDCICNMDKMKDIELSDNQFTGQIPDLFQGCRNMETMFFSRNNFTGTLPRSLGGVVNLTVVDVSGNGLYGTVPNSFNKLTYIAELAICFNMFSDVENGLDDFFKRIKDYTCLFYNNPWSCPLTTTVPKACSATCSTCNAGAQHESCSECVKSSECGWCQKGLNCLKQGSSQEPETYYKCMSEDWKVGSC